LIEAETFAKMVFGKKAFGRDLIVARLMTGTADSDASHALAQSRTQ
jgi:hypothetical protein